MNARLFLIALLAVISIGCGAVNQPIHIEDGSVVEGGLSTVNGAIRIGDDCQVKGSLSNVNGSIEVGEGSTVGSIRNTNGSITLRANVQSGDISTTNGSLSLGAGSVVDGRAAAVNGRIRAEENVSIKGDLSTVKGRLDVASGGRIEGKVATVNGSIELDQSHVGAVETVAGSIKLTNGSVVDGELRVKAPSRPNQEIPQITIGADSRVGGPLTFEREVRLFIHDSAEVGEIVGATPEYYSGDQPPA
jgi:DUF4097 and DUF4098 domain-containing protein YvlB